MFSPNGPGCRPPSGWILLLGTTLFVGVSCGGNSGAGDGAAAAGGPQLGGSGGITGSGRSEGEITGFGSVWVSGVRWNTDSAEISVDGETATQDDLHVGMVVIVDGDEADDGESGEASRVSFRTRLWGPIESVTPVGDDGGVVDLAVLGQAVRVDDDVTNFDRADPLLSADGLAVGDVVQVSGLVDDRGLLHASFLRRRGRVAFGSTPVRFRGTISELLAGSFRVGALRIEFDVLGRTTDLSDLSQGLLNGLRVEIEGILLASGEIRALRIEEEEDGFRIDIRQARLEGFVTGFSSLSRFRVAGRICDATNAEFDPGDFSFLEDGARVEVEGSVVAGVFIVRKVKWRDLGARIAAEIKDVASIDPAQRSFDLLGVRVITTFFTQFRGARGGRIDVGDLAEGDYLRVRGFQIAPSTLLATRIRRRDQSDDILLRGRVQEFDAAQGTVTILGVAVPANDETEYEGRADQSISREEFFRRIARGVVVQAEDDEDGNEAEIDFADEFEIESDD